MNGINFKSFSGQQQSGRFASHVVGALPAVRDLNGVIELRTPTCLSRSGSGVVTILARAVMPDKQGMDVASLQYVCGKPCSASCNLRSEDYAAHVLRDVADSIERVESTAKPKISPDSSYTIK